MLHRKGAQQPLAGRGQPDQNFALIVASRVARHSTALGQAVDQLQRAVRSDLQPLGQFSDGRQLAFRQALYREKKLVLLRLDSAGARGFLAIAQEAADLVAQLGERPVGFGRQIPCHIYIVSRYKFISPRRPSIRKKRSNRLRPS